MPLKNNNLHPLSLLGLRKLDYIPKHFGDIIVDPNCDLQLLDHWINYNLNSRYAIIKTVTLTDSNKVTSVIKVGLEDPKEISMLVLGCPFLTRKEIF